MASNVDNNKFIEDIFPYPLDLAIDWIAKNLCPEDVFNKNDLEAWAKENGYIHEDDI